MGKMSLCKRILLLLLSLIIVLFFQNETRAIPFKAGKQAQENYKKNGYKYEPYLATYKPFGDYFNASKRNFQTERLTKDKNGIVMVKYGDQYQYNPVTIAQFALTSYGKYIKTSNVTDKNEFLKYADALIGLQGKDGALRYNFEYRKPYLHTKYKKGWVSAMAQGQALSVYARAYHITGNTKYLNAGKMAFKFLNTPKSKGGTLTTLADISKNYKDYIFYEEYISTPNNYTLNGYMFTLIGLYDWSQVKTKADYGQKEADKMFKKGIASLVILLPKYDIGGFTSYDLSGITMKQRPHVLEAYHAVHIYQLYGLYTITGNPILLNYHKLWASYVKQ